MIQRIARKIKMISLRRYSFLPPIGDELKKIEDLRKTVGGIDFTEETTSEWLRNQKTLRHLILSKDPRDFLNWPVIAVTMFHDAHKSEYEALRHSPRWEQLYRQNMFEDIIGNPSRSAYALGSSGNLIHHAYAVEHLYFIPGFDISELSSIMEFGGGYGGLCRLVYRFGFRGVYEIFDFKIFAELQKYFILGTSVSTFFEKMRFINKSENIGVSPDLFISLWALSESPLLLRMEIMKKIDSPKYILIGYQTQFSGIDNVQYFNDLKTQMNNYEWIEKDIVHIPGNRYLIGARKGGVI